MFCYWEMKYSFTSKLQNIYKFVASYKKFYFSKRQAILKSDKLYVNIIFVLITQIKILNILLEYALL